MPAHVLILVLPVKSLPTFIAGTSFSCWISCCYQPDFAVVLFFVGENPRSETQVSHNYCFEGVFLFVYLFLWLSGSDGNVSNVAFF
jgi:hypothetical protein